MLEFMCYCAWIKISLECLIKNKKKLWLLPDGPAVKTSLS